MNPAEEPPFLGYFGNIIEENINYNETELFLNNYHHRMTEFPREIIELTNLKQLSLTDNHLTTLPPEINQLELLEFLYLRKNRIITLPCEIGQLTRLRYLGLSHNQLTVLPNSIVNLVNLQELSLDNNLLKTLPDNIGNLRKLTKLTLNNNILTTLPNSIVNLKHLRYLYLNHNNFEPNDNLFTILNTIKNFRSIINPEKITYLINELLKKEAILNVLHSRLDGRAVKHIGSKVGNYLNSHSGGKKKTKINKKINKKRVTKKNMKKDSDYYFHGSTINIKNEILKPKSSNVIDNEKAVFATNNKSLSVLFMAKWDDSHIQAGFYNNTLIVEEIYDGAFDKLKVSGYIYYVDPKQFKNDKRLGMQGYEFISNETVKILKRVEIKNAYNYLKRQKDIKLVSFFNKMKVLNQYFK